MAAESVACLPALGIFWASPLSQSLRDRSLFWDFLERRKEGDFRRSSGSIQLTILGGHSTISPFRRLRRLITTSTVPPSTIPISRTWQNHHCNCACRSACLSLSRADRQIAVDEWGFHEVAISAAAAASTAVSPVSLLHRGGDTRFVRVPCRRRSPLPQVPLLIHVHPPQRKHFRFFVAPSVVRSQLNLASSSWAQVRPFLHSVELVVVVVVVDKEERRLVAEEGTLFQSGDDPWEKKRMPVAPAAASSLRAGRGGRWSAFDSVAAAGGDEP